MQLISQKRFAMPIVIKKKKRVKAEPIVEAEPENLLMEGYTAQESIDIANKALDEIIIFLAKKAAREDYERSLKGNQP